MKFYKKVQYLKRKVWIDFGDDSPYRFGLGAQMGPKTSIFLLSGNQLMYKHFKCSEIVPSMLNTTNKVWIDFWGLWSQMCRNLRPKRGQNKHFFSFHSITCV